MGSGAIQRSRRLAVPGVSLERMLRPQRAVFIGGASTISAIEWCRQTGFEGELAAVNPNRSELAGVACVPSVAELAHAPDIAFVAVPKEAVVATIAELRAIGAGGAVVNSSGFSEMEGGHARTLALVDAAGDMPLLGPNTPGFANFVDQAYFMQEHFGSHDGKAGVAVISNGGAYLSDTGLNARSVPIAYLVGTGNEALISTADVMLALVSDERITAINLYLESIPDAHVLSMAAQAAHERGIPVVAVKGGRTPVGARATRSHTAALAGDAEIASALFERLGFAEATTASEALETLKALTMTRPIRGRRLGFVTSSGSYAVLGGDMAHRVGFTIDPIGALAEARLEELLPPFVHPTNPLDISTDHGASADHQRATYDAFLTPEVDLAVQVMAFPPVDSASIDDWYATSRAFASSAAARDLPCAFVATTAESLPKQARIEMIENGMAPLMDLEDGFRALANAATWFERQAAIAQHGPDSIVLPSPQEHQSDAGRLLDEAASKRLLAEHGVAVPESVVAHVADVPHKLPGSGPWVVKALGDNLLHKTELGAIVLGCADRSAVVEAADDLHDRIGCDRVLVEETVRDGIAEVFVGVRHTSRVGRVLTVGIGGTLVELLDDAVTVILPVPAAAIESALRRLRLFPLLDGYRNHPVANLDGLIGAIAAIADAAEGLEILEVEVNPLIALRDGAAVAVDAVIRVEH